MSKIIFLSIALLICTSTVFATSCAEMEEGASYVAEDGCNSCVCQSGEAHCTEFACSGNSGDSGVVCPQNYHQAYGTPLLSHCNSQSKVNAPSQVAVGCVSDGARCIFMERFAMSPSGEIYLFHDCIPEDFTPVQVNCEEVSASCTSETRTALAVPKENFCADSSMTTNVVLAGCVVKSSFCLMTTTFASKDGQVYAFQDSCVPDGYEVVSESCQAPTVSCLADEVPIVASLLDNFCSGKEISTSVTLGCRKTDSICTQAFTYGQNENGEIYVFHDGCMPESFHPVVASCSVGACITGDREIRAQFLSNFCGAESETQTVLVGCIPEDSMCPEMITFAKDVFGEVMVFHDGCIPETFTVVDSVGCAIEETDACTASQRALRAYPANTFCSQGAEAASIELGCMDNAIQCTGSLTFASDKSGNVYLFTDSCIPEGFSTVQTSCSQITAASSCTANQRVVMAAPKENYCSTSAESQVEIAVGCVENNLMCIESTIFAQNADGHVYVFHDGCLPEGFTQVDEVCEGVCALGSRPVLASSASESCWNAEAAAHTQRVVGCVAADSFCLMVQTIARERGTGEYMLFSDNCIPENFEVTPEVNTCDDMVCLPLSCGEEGRVCVVRPTECDSEECVPEAYCAAPECVGHGINEEFNIECNSCTCDETGHLFCTKKRCPVPEPSIDCSVDQHLVMADEAETFCFGGRPGNKAETQAVGCVDKHTNCMMRVTYARRLFDGVVFRFHDSCVPEGFNVLEDVSTCENLVCEDYQCGEGQVCIAQAVECFTTPCPPVPVCADSSCEGYYVDEEFESECGATCSCDASGALSCGECASGESVDDGEEDSNSSATMIAMGTAGAAAASLGLAMGYRKYYRKRGEPLITMDDGYNTFRCTESDV